MFRVKHALSFAVILVLIPFIQSSAQNDIPYDQGTVWTLTFVRTEANKGNDYLKDLSKTWVASMEEGKKEGLIENFKVLSGAAANQDDYNLILMIEYKSLGSLDPNKEMDAKWDAIQKKVKDQMGDKFDKVVDNYSQIRQIFGSKLMRELIPKK